MCMVSMVMDGYHPWDKLPINPQPVDISLWVENVSRAEFEKLRLEVLELRQLILAAMKFDKNTGQPNCHNEDKLALLKSLADALGVDLQDIK